MTLLALLVPAVIAALITAALAPLTRKLAFAVGAIDRPGERKIHSAPVPRLGGLAVLISAAVVLFALRTVKPFDHLLNSRLLVGLAIGILPVLAISILDDIRPLSPLPKLLAQIAAAVIAVISFGIRLGPDVHLFGKVIHLGWWAVLISIVWIVGVTNAFNLIDGLDGLSAGLALISSLSLAGVSLLQSSYGVAAVALVVAGALVGFLPFNVYPARMFLGDSGAASIGYILACIAVGGISPRVSAGMAILVPVVVLGLPIADTLISICRRVVRRMANAESFNILEGDRQHIHHRLLELGLHQKDAVLILYVIGIVLSGCAIGSMFLTSQSAALLLLTIMAASFVGISRLGYDEFALIRRGVMLRYYDAPVLRMSLFVVFIDLALSVAALYGAIVLKYDDFEITATRNLARSLLPLLPAITLTVFCAFRVYWRTWRTAGLSELLRPLAASFTAGAAAWLICRISLLEPRPPTFFVLYALVLGVAAVGARASYRLLHEWSRRAATDRSDAMPVAIYTAGVRGAMALQNLLSNEGYGMRPVGFIDDDPKKAGKYVKGYRVFGSLDDLPEVIARERVKAVIVASERIDPERLIKANEMCRTAGTALLSFNVNFRVEEFAPDGKPAEKPIPPIVPMPLYQHGSDLSH